MKLMLEDLLVADALVCMRYGSKQNALAAGAYAPKESKAPEETTVLQDSVARAEPSRKPPKSKLYTNSKKARQSKIISTNANGGVPIGSGVTIVPSECYQKIRWKDYRFATRSLLDALFTKSVLATSSMTGKPSPAFPYLAAKKPLDPQIVSDISEEIKKRYGVKKDQIRHVITTKCADESKIAKNVRKKKERRRTSRG